MTVCVLARELLGADLCAHIERLSLALYAEAGAYALQRGLILADTKFEFGLIPLSSLSPSPSTHSRPASPVIDVDGVPHALILVDEALTPDSSRYWSSESYAPGRAQASFDKQFLRDWLKTSGFKKGLESGPEGHEGEGWEMTAEVVRGTMERYEEVVKLLGLITKRQDADGLGRLPVGEP